MVHYIFLIGFFFLNEVLQKHCWLIMVANYTFECNIFNNDLETIVSSNSIFENLGGNLKKKIKKEGIKLIDQN